MARLPVTVSFDGAPAARTDSHASVPSPGPVMLHFSGRLDNRSELRAALAAPRDLSDSDLVLAAMARWGTSAPARMLGDFAFVAWYPRERRAVLARDHLGIRTLYFHAARSRLSCASEIGDLLADPAVPRTIDGDSIAEFLAGVPRNGSRTLYAHVSRVPPGHVAIVGPEGVQFLCYWTAEPKRAIRYAADSEYEAHCRSLLVDSVGCRMDDAERTAVTLSGGIDSSAVTVVAHLLVPGKVPPRPFSLVFPGEPAADERPFIADVEDRVSCPSVLVPSARADVAVLARWARRSLDLPPTPSDAMSAPLWHAMAARGCRVALTGVGGDYVFSGSYFAYADLFRRGRWGTAVRDWRLARDGTAGAHGASNLFVKGVWPALPSGVKRTFRPLARSVARLPAHAARSWLRLDAQAEPHPAEPRAGSFAVEEIIRGLTSGLHGYFIEGAARAARDAGIELRHPLLDVRLVEFMLAIPEEQRRTGAFGKRLLRRCLGGELPPSVASRTCKGDFSHAVHEVFESAGPSFYADLALARRGWVDGAAVASMFRTAARTSTGAAPGDDIPMLWGLTAAEIWLRALEEAGATATV